MPGFQRISATFSSNEKAGPDGPALVHRGISALEDLSHFGHVLLHVAVGHGNGGEGLVYELKPLDQYFGKTKKYLYRDGGLQFHELAESVPGNGINHAVLGGYNRCGAGGTLEERHFSKDIPLGEDGKGHGIVVPAVACGGGAC